VPQKKKQWLLLRKLLVFPEDRVVLALEDRVILALEENQVLNKMLQLERLLKLLWLLVLLQKKQWQKPLPRQGFPHHQVVLVEIL
jgi:hypothetical protein